MAATKKEAPPTSVVLADSHKTLAVLFTNAAAFASRDTSRPILTAVRLRTTKDGIELASTDSYALLMQHLATDATPGPGMEVLLDIAELRRVLRFCRPSDFEYIAVTTDASVVEFAGGSISVPHVNPGEIGYPNVDSLLDKYRKAPSSADFALGVATLGKLGALKVPPPFNVEDYPTLKFRATGPITPVVATSSDHGEGWSAEALLMPVRAS